MFELNNDDLSYGEIIKIDTQGTELEILKAGLRTLTQRTYAIMTEVSFAELYKGQALFSDVESFLRPLGFKFYGFDLFRNRSLNFLDKKVNWSRERCIQADAFFIKDPLDENITKPLDKRSSAILLWPVQFLVL